MRQNVLDKDLAAAKINHRNDADVIFYIEDRKLADQIS